VCASSFVYLFSKLIFQILIINGLTLFVHAILRSLQRVYGHRSSSPLTPWRWFVNTRKSDGGVYVI